MHWAGTETAKLNRGFVDGAVESGRRAAREVITRMCGAESWVEGAVPQYTFDDILMPGAEVACRKDYYSVCALYMIGAISISVAVSAVGYRILKRT